MATTTTTTMSSLLTPPHSNFHFLSQSKAPCFYKPRKPPHFSISLSSSDNNTPTATTATATATEEKKVLEASSEPEVVVVVKDVPKTTKGKFEKSEDSVGVSEVMEASINATKFKDSRWVNGSWDLPKFVKDGVTDWDSLIDAEAKRRKWLQTYPESTTNDEPVIFDTSIIPWWAWIKRFHLPEAELLNGRAAMVGFFMSYFVDSLTGLGVVDQMGNFFCKTLLFVSVLGVLFIRKNEDVENLKKLFEETTFYDKQWQATWQEETKKD